MPQVDKGSRADKAGFRAGDVIVRVNGEAIHDSGDFSHALHSRKENTASVSIIRDKKEQTLTLTLPERKQSEMFEESLDVPEIDTESLNIDLSELRSEMAHLRPQISEAVREAQRAMDDARESLSQQREQLRKHAKEMKKQQKEELKQQEEELKEQQQELKQEMKEQQQELRDQVQIELHGLSEI